MEIVVFTNGCFDLIHPGHIDLLKKARALGTKLIVGLNSDRSVRAIKGSRRPILNEAARSAVLQELRSVDEVRIFEENTPEKLIKEIKPDILVKGGDWAPNQIVGADFVLKNGGKVFSIPFVEDFSTSKIAEKIKSTENFNELQGALIKAESDFIENYFQAHLDNFEKLRKSEIENIARSVELIYKALENGNKIHFFSYDISADCTEYLAKEFARQIKSAGFYSKFVVLPKNSEASENELRIKEFSDYLDDHARENDLVINLFEEGNSPKVLSVLMKAREQGCRTLGLTGTNNIKFASLCDASVSVSEKNTENAPLAFIAIVTLWGEIIKEKNKNSL